jgi:hypothetical protein
MIDYALILNRKFNGEWTLNNNDYNELQWLSDTPKPTKKQLDDLWDEVLEDIESEKQAEISKKNAAKAKLQVLGLTVEDLEILGIL